MTKKNILLKLLDNKIVKIYGTDDLKNYTPSYFKLDKDLNVLYYNKDISLTNNFDKHSKSLSDILNGFMRLQKEGFKLEFFDILLLK